MTDYELKILNFISNNPFCRQRNIAAHLYTSITNQQFLDAMFKLYKENYINCDRQRKLCYNECRK